MELDFALLWVVIGGFLEPVWVIGLKKYNDTRSLLWGAVAVAFMFISPMFIAFSMEDGMSVGVAYSIWTGIGSISTIIAGMLLYKERLERVKVVFVTLIIIGIVGLELSSELGI
ncbi:MAG: multidrug efflux SMR transporter [Candidatus Methanomethylophilaceae archaeon]|nr:multidrug efflux SMR transporter [Candidatus Methanomethylophilaceae archaeon]